MVESDEIDIIANGGNCGDKIVKKSLSKNSNKFAEYITLEGRLAFIQLKKAFIKASSLGHFNPECYI